MSAKITNEQRAVIVNKALDNAQIPTYRRSGIVKETMNVSPATASGWLAGSLPKEPRALLLFADTYGLDVNLWVFGEERVSGGDGITESKLEALTIRLKEFEVTNNRTLTPKQFGKLFILLLRDEEKAKYFLDNASVFLSE